MWPWGHAALGYVLYSVIVRAWPGREVTDGPVLVLVIATQLPDFVDKSLAWGFGVVGSGYAVGHSAFVALPLGVAACGILATLSDRPLVGVAVVVGWWSHLAGDVLFGVLTGQESPLAVVAWPVVRLEGADGGGVFDRVLGYLDASADLVLGGGSPLVAALLVGTPFLALVLWILDGAPVATTAVRKIRLLEE